MPIPWKVVLIGDQQALERLSLSLSRGRVVIAKSGTEYCVTGEVFANMNAAAAVREAALELAEQLSGVAGLLLGNVGRLSVGAVYQDLDDGSRIASLTVTEGIRIRDDWAAVTVKEDGSVERSDRTDPVAEWIQAAAADSEVARALRLVNGGDLAWVDLYNLVELVEANSPAELTEGWVPKARRRLLKHTASSISAVGDEARHGREWQEPPAYPMDLTDARQLARQLVRRWLDWRIQALAEGS